jgi:hypothetical protein
MEIKRKLPKSIESKRLGKRQEKPHPRPQIAPIESPRLLSSIKGQQTPSLPPLLRPIMSLPPAPLPASLPAPLSHISLPISKPKTERNRADLPLERRIEDLEDKVRQLHENYTLFWNELINCRHQLQGEHQVLQNVTQLLATAYAPEEREGKHAREIIDLDRQKEEEQQRRYSMVLQSLYYGIPQGPMTGMGPYNGSFGGGGLVGTTATDLSEGRGSASLGGGHSFDEYFAALPYNIPERKEHRTENYTGDSTLKEP